MALAVLMLFSYGLPMPPSWVFDAWMQNERRHEIVRWAADISHSTRYSALDVLQYADVLVHAAHGVGKSAMLGAWIEAATTPRVPHPYAITCGKQAVALWRRARGLRYRADDLPPRCLLRRTQWSPLIVWDEADPEEIDWSMLSTYHEDGWVHQRVIADFLARWPGGRLRPG